MKHLDLLLALLLSPMLLATNLSLDTADVAASDVNFRPMLPVQGASAEIGVTVHNSSESSLPATVSVALADGTANGCRVVRHAATKEVAFEGRAVA